MHRFLTAAPAIALLGSVLTSGSMVTVSGAVEQPGGLAITKTMGLRTALESAGGLREDADPKKIEIRSADGSSKIVDASKLGPVATLRPGDTVSVPILNEDDYVFIKGAVALPGMIEYSPGLTLRDAVRQAAPFDEVGLSTVRLTRTLADGTSETLEINLDAVESDAAEGIALEPADRIEVPYVGQGKSDRDLLTIVVIGLLVILLLR
ncbi:MAG: SLBB domain-containing protein [Armatimonadetes bacterium]|nr:SLBB domain-containing protein [Armatimonadota bacterium]